MLSYLPNPLQRLTMAQNARRLLRHPSHCNPEKQPHDGGIFMIVEKESIFHNISNTNKKNNTKTDQKFTTSSPLHHPGQRQQQDLLSQWKDVICAVGFECIKYQLVTSSAVNRQKFHVFVFKTIHPSLHQVDMKWLNVGLQIRQDFTHIKTDEKEKEEVPHPSSSNSRREEEVEEEEV